MGEDDDSPWNLSSRGHTRGSSLRKGKDKWFVAVVFFPFAAHVWRELEEGKVEKRCWPCRTPLTLPASCSVRKM